MIQQVGNLFIFERVKLLHLFFVHLTRYLNIFLDFLCTFNQVLLSVLFAFIQFAYPPLDVYQADMLALLYKISWDFPLNSPVLTIKF